MVFLPHSRRPTPLSNVHSSGGLESRLRFQPAGQPAGERSKRQLLPGLDLNLGINLGNLLGIDINLGGATTSSSPAPATTPPPTVTTRTPSTTSAPGGNSPPPPGATTSRSPAPQAPPSTSAQISQTNAQSVPTPPPDAAGNDSSSSAAASSSGPGGARPSGGDHESSGMNDSASAGALPTSSNDQDNDGAPAEGVVSDNLDDDGTALLLEGESGSDEFGSAGGRVRTQVYITTDASGHATTVTARLRPTGTMSDGRPYPTNPNDPNYPGDDTTPGGGGGNTNRIVAGVAAVVFIVFGCGLLIFFRRKWKKSREKRRKSWWAGWQVRHGESASDGANSPGLANTVGKLPHGRTRGNEKGDWAGNGEGVSSTTPRSSFGTSFDRSATRPSFDPFANQMPTPMVQVEAAKMRLSIVDEAVRQSIVMYSHPGMQFAENGGLGTVDELTFSSSGSRSRTNSSMMMPSPAHIPAPLIPMPYSVPFPAQRPPSLGATQPVHQPTANRRRSTIFSRIGFGSLGSRDVRRESPNRAAQSGAIPQLPELFEDPRLSMGGFSEGHFADRSESCVSSEGPFSDTHDSALECRSVLSPSRSSSSQTHPNSWRSESELSHASFQLRVVVRRAFAKTRPDEMTISPGDVVAVLHSFDDGWAVVERCAASPDGEARSMSRDSRSDVESLVALRRERGMVPMVCLEESEESWSET